MQTISSIKGNKIRGSFHQNAFFKSTMIKFISLWVVLCSVITFVSSSTLTKITLSNSTLSYR